MVRAVEGTPAARARPNGSASEAASVRWHDVVDDDLSAFADLARRYGLPALAVEDVAEAGQRPKLETYHDDGAVFVVVDAASYDDAREAVDLLQVRIFLLADAVITVRPRALRTVSTLHAAHEAGTRTLTDPAAVVHAVLDRIVDGYDPIVDGLSEDVREVETEVFSPELTNPAQRIYELKREVLRFGRSLSPLVGPVRDLRMQTIAGVPDEVDDRLRDVEDHLRRQVSELELLNDQLGNVLHANLAQISVHQNAQMRKISAWAAIFLLPTLLAAVWGMNFDHMPELDWSGGYPTAIGTMAAASLALFWWFRRREWL